MNPFVGHLLEGLRRQSDLHDWRHEILEKYGFTVTIPEALFKAGEIITADPANIQHILKDNFNNYIKPSLLADIYAEVLGDSIFAVNHAHTKDNGYLWRLQRKIASKVFTANALKAYSKDVFAHHVTSLLRSLEEHSLRDDVVDLQQLFSSFALRSIYNIGFGLDLTQRQDEEKFNHCFTNALEISTLRWLRPWYSFLWWLMPSEWELRKYIRYMNQVSHEIIEARMRESSEDIEKKADILSLFLQRKNEFNELDVQKLLRDVIISFILAGRDTTASALTWAMYMIIENPLVQKKLLEEIDIKLNNKIPKYEDLKDLQYLDAVVHETMRLYPPVPVDPKECVKDDYLPDGTFVPAGTSINYVPYSIGRNPNLWENPSEFKPERWENMKKRPTAYEYPVFQAGPRLCLGQSLALIEVKMAISMILQRFTFERISKVPAQYIFTVTLVMKDGLPVRVIPRRSVPP